jgi:hypothetical protein
VYITLSIDVCSFCCNCYGVQSAKSTDCGIREVGTWHYVIEGGDFRSMKLFSCRSHFNEGRA